jgi:hypothetical protein
MKLIATTTLSSSATNVEFTSIPGTYTDLLVTISARADRADVADVMGIRINGDNTNGNYTNRSIVGDGGNGVVSNYISSSNLELWIAHFSAANTTASTFGNAQVYFSNYSGNTNKSFSAQGASENNAAAGYNDMKAGLWSNTNAITSLKFICLFGTNMVSGTTLSLYGITKGSDGIVTTS